MRHQSRVAVVCGVRRDDAALAGDGFGHPERDVIGLRSRAGQDCGVQCCVKRAGKPLHIVQKQFVQVTGMRVQNTRLRADRIDHARVAMSDMRHIIIAVQVFSSLSIPDPNTVAAHDVYRVIIEGGNIGSKQCSAPRN